MRRILSAALDFVVGDDLWVAVGVAGAVLLTATLALFSLDPWWVLPLAVPAIVAASLVRAAPPRAARRDLATVLSGRAEV